MTDIKTEQSLSKQFKALYELEPAVIASAPGRLEVLGNHTDYNAGLTLSCAVEFRCYAALAPISDNELCFASTLFAGPPHRFSLDHTNARQGHWTNYLLGLVRAIQDHGHAVPGLALLVHSDVPRSAGVSSSAALEMAVAMGLDALLDLNMPAIELARIGQYAESSAVGAQTGLLDQLSSLLGKRDHLLRIDFRSLQTEPVVMPEGWCFVAVDSGVKHDLTKEYNDRRASCEAAARLLGVRALRDANLQMLSDSRKRLPDDAARCAEHVIGENDRVRDAVAALASGEIKLLGELMFQSHQSSKVNFLNSCPELDMLVDFGRSDRRCVGARLSGGGFGGISIHLVRQDDATSYREDLLQHLAHSTQAQRWSAICKIDDGAMVHR